MRMDEEDLCRMNRVLRHRLRNFASGIKNAVSLLESEVKDILPSDSLEYFPLIKGECDQLDRLTQRLSLVFDRDCPARVAARTTGPGRTIGAVLQQALEATLADNPTANITVDLDERLRTEPVSHGAALALALAEIARNAVESSKSAQVRLACVRNDDSLCFQVTDTGPGVSSGDPSQIFLPFHTTRGKHTGIGLSIAAEVLAEYGGQLSAQANPAGGLTVTAQVPHVTG